MGEGSTPDALVRDHAPDVGPEIADLLRARLPELGQAANEPLMPAFVAHLAARARAYGAPWLSGCHIKDLYLAFASAQRQASALTELDALLRDSVRQHLAHIDSRRQFADEVQQALREHLLLPSPADAKILEYEGRGPLAGWLRVAAIRRALNLRRSEARRDARHQTAPPIAAPAVDPSLDYLRQRYAPEVQAALDEALAELSTDERNVLRLHFLDGLSAEEIAAAYAIHRTTAWRWITSARETILTAVRRHLKASLRLSESELDSVLRMVTSTLDVSIEHLLRTHPGA